MFARRIQWQPLSKYKVWVIKVGQNIIDNSELPIQKKKFQDIAED